MSVSYLLWRDIFKKCCHAKAFKIQNDPTRSASLINLFELGRVVHSMQEPLLCETNFINAIFHKSLDDEFLYARVALASYKLFR